MFKSFDRDEAQTILNKIGAGLNIYGSTWKSLSYKQKQSVIIKEMLQAGNIVLDHIDKYSNLSKFLLDFKETHSVENLHCMMVNILRNLPNKGQASPDVESDLIIFLLEKDLFEHNVNRGNDESLKMYVQNMDLDLIDDSMDLQKQTKQLYFACQKLNRIRIEQNFELIRLLPEVLKSDKISKRVLLWKKTIFNVILEKVKVLVYQDNFNLLLQELKNKVITQIKLVDNSLKNYALKDYERNQSSCYNNLLCFIFGTKYKAHDDFLPIKKSCRLNKSS